MRADRYEGLPAPLMKKKTTSHRPFNASYKIYDLRSSFFYSASNAPFLWFERISQNTRRRSPYRIVRTVDFRLEPCQPAGSSSIHLFFFRRSVHFFLYDATQASSRDPGLRFAHIRWRTELLHSSHIVYTFNVVSSGEENFPFRKFAPFRLSFSFQLVGTESTKISICDVAVRSEKNSFEDSPLS